MFRIKGRVFFFIDFLLLLYFIPRKDLSRTEKQRDVWKLRWVKTAITNLLFSSAVVRAGRYKISSKTTDRLSVTQNTR